MTDSYAGADLHETLVPRKAIWKDPQRTAETDISLPNGNSNAAPKLPQGARQRKTKPEKDSDDDEAQPAAAAAVLLQAPEKKPRSSRKVGAKVVEKLVEESVEEEVTVTTSKTGQKRKVQVSKRSTTQSKKGKATTEEHQQEEEVVVEVKSAAPGPPWTMLVHKKPQPDWTVYNPDTMRPDPPASGTKTMKVMSWNVNGLRALMKDKEKKAQEGLLITTLAQEEDFDVLCLQETKLQVRIRSPRLLLRKMQQS